MPKMRTMTESDDEDEQEQYEFEAAFAKRHRKTRPTDILEVCARLLTRACSDVGGGSVRNDTRHCLARIPLRWMIRECFKVTFLVFTLQIDVNQTPKADTGIMFDAQRLQELGLDPATLYPFVLPRPPPLPVGSTDRIETIPPRKGWLRRLFSRNRKKDECDFPVSPELENTPLEKPAHGMEEEEEAARRATAHL
ncbi:hypothetical protein MSAN_01757900 [Mycena sanguinolenta]|uniref:Uncharacterized protein n=1 Tax=Mycena sanguinolenta TaxID=230812 RepID=A0A8H7CS01_9AGAR|nr:hypothetical protein MSAN_01757900 [Mycena sanguinolenta]